MWDIIRIPVSPINRCIKDTLCIHSIYNVMNNEPSGKESEGRRTERGSSWVIVGRKLSSVSANVLEYGTGQLCLV